MQNVRPAYTQLITGFGLKWGEKKMTNTDKQWQIIIKSSGALIRV